MNRNKFKSDIVGVAKALGKNERVDIIMKHDNKDVNVMIKHIDDYYKIYISKYNDGVSSKSRLKVKNKNVDTPKEVGEWLTKFIDQ